MNKVIDLNSYRIQATRKKCFSAWEKRFNETFLLTICLGDISDQTLYRLAHPGEESSNAFYEFIMGALDLGPTAKFGYLEEKEKLRIIDLHLFLADNARFELMWRLGWLNRYAAQEIQLVELVQKAAEYKLKFKDQIPELSPTHTEYDNFRGLIPRDKDALIRRLLIPALEEFKQRI